MKLNKEVVTYRLDRVQRMRRDSRPKEWTFHLYYCEVEYYKESPNLLLFRIFQETCKLRVRKYMCVSGVDWTVIKKKGFFSVTFL